MNSPLPVPGITWQAPAQGKTVHCDHAAEAKYGNEIHWHRATNELNSSPSVTTVPGIIDKSQARPNWHQRSTLNKFRQDPTTSPEKPNRACPGTPQR